MKILNLGGVKKLKRSSDVIAVNLDGIGDIDHDLNIFPYPFKEKTFDTIIISHTIEHLQEPLKVMREIWRLGKPNALLLITIPHWLRFTSFSDPHHLREFKVQWFKSFDPALIKKHKSKHSTRITAQEPDFGFTFISSKTTRGRFKFWRFYEVKIIMKVVKNG